MKILFVSLGGTLPFRAAGPSVVAYNLVRQFDKLGLNVEFVFGISEAQSAKEACLQSLDLSSNVQLLPVVKNRKLATEYNASIDLRFLKSAVSLARRMRNAFDVVHFCTLPNSADVFMSPIACIRNVPSIINMHSWPTLERTYKRGALPFYNYVCHKLQTRFLTRVVCNSRYLEQKARLEGIDPRKIAIIPNGVDVETFSNSRRKMDLPGDPALLYVGRLEHEKGVDILVKSMKELLRDLPDAVLHILGNGTMMKEVEALVRSNQLQTAVLLHGTETKDDLAAFYQSADICVFPSRYDCLPLTILEAMAAGKPIIATRVGAIPERLEHLTNGLLTQPDMHDLKEAILRLWNDKDLMERCRKNNLRKAECYDWARIADDYLHLYHGVLSNS